jgi:hypothetical protein
MASVENPISPGSDARPVDARKPLPRTTTAQHLKSSAITYAGRAVKEHEMGKLFLIGVAIAAATWIGMAVFVIQL